MRLSYASVMVEVDARQPLKDHIILRGPGNVMKKQDIIHEYNVSSV